jgi:molybdate transport system substrate-binding protein
MKSNIAVGLMIAIGAVGWITFRTAIAQEQLPRSILVFAAASTTNALNEIKALFTKETGIAVQINFAASSTLSQQIVHGAEPDVFLSADTRWTDYLKKRHFIAQQCNLLGNRLVIVVPKDSKLNIKEPKDLLATEIEHVALGEIKSVPAGRYAKQALMQLGLWEPVRAKVVSAESVQHALKYVETGAAEAGIVYATDAAASEKVRMVAEIPEKLTGPICYPLVLLKHGENNPSAQAFYRYVGSVAAKQIFQKYGFSIPSEMPCASKSIQ